MAEGLSKFQVLTPNYETVEFEADSVRVEDGGLEVFIADRLSAAWAKGQWVSFRRVAA